MTGKLPYFVPPPFDTQPGPAKQLVVDETTLQLDPQHFNDVEVDPGELCGLFAPFLTGRAPFSPFFPFLLSFFSPFSSFFSSFLLFLSLSACSNCLLVASLTCCSDGAGA